jgi:predicted DNA-binding transcriptional regulator AlpA
MAKNKSRRITTTARPKHTDVVATTSPPPSLHGIDDDALLDTASTAIWLGVSHQWLELARNKGYGPRYIKVTSRIVRYRRGDILAYLKSRTINSSNAVA